MRRGERERLMRRGEREADEMGRKAVGKGDHMRKEAAEEAGNKAEIGDLNRSADLV